MASFRNQPDVTVVSREAALKQFTAYFVKNYPGPNTVICKPEWHAPKIFRAAELALKEAAAPDVTAVASDQIKHMVDRFLGWRLPENFNPDAGISFKPHINSATGRPYEHGPTGTNLFDASQAEEMVRYMLDGIAALPTRSEAQIRADECDHLRNLVHQQEDHIPVLTDNCKFQICCDLRERAAQLRKLAGDQ